MNIIAKMYVTSIDEYSMIGDKPSAEHPKTGENITLSAVIDDTPENKSFSEATPSASLVMYITNPAAFGQFEKGKEYYVKFLPAESTEAASD